MSLLNIALELAAWSVFAAPAVFLVIGVLLFHFKPIHRAVVGLIWSALGIVGLIIFSFLLYVSTIESSTPQMALYVGIFEVPVESLTLAIGIISLLKKSKPEKTKK